MKLENYIAGKWITGDGEGQPLYNAVTGEPIASASTKGLDLKQMLEYGRTVGNPALRRMTFHERGNMLKALAIIFLVLAIQFESVRDPLVIMVSVPLAISGALIALAWGMATMNIYSQVGLITLVGLITKHGILICEVAKEEQLLHGLNRMQAVMQAAKVRLRPILMTTAGVVAGLIPLLYASGAGAAQRFSIGIVIVAGLAIGTLFTLFVLPVIYTFLASEHKPLPEFDESIPAKAKGGH